MQAINDLRKLCQRGKLFVWQFKTDKMATEKTTGFLYPQWKNLSTSFSISSGLPSISLRNVLSP